MWFKPPQSGSKPHTSSTGPSAISSFRSLTGTSPTTYCHCRWGFDKVGFWPRAMQSPSQPKVLLFDLSLVWFATQLCLIGLNLTLSLTYPCFRFLLSLRDAMLFLLGVVWVLPCCKTPAHPTVPKLLSCALRPHHHILTLSFTSVGWVLPWTWKYLYV